MNNTTWNNLNAWAREMTLIVTQNAHDNWRLSQIVKEVEQTLDKLQSEEKHDIQQ